MVLVDNRLVTDFLAKANLFNDFFSKQCSTIVNNNSLPTNLTFETENRLSTFGFSTGDIIMIIKALDPNKAHGHNGTSIRMIKLCAISISKPSHILFKNCLENNVSPMNEKREILFLLTRKEGDNQLIINFRPVWLLPICAKGFEKIICNSLFEFLNTNKLLNSNQ